MRTDLTLWLQSRRVARSVAWLAVLVFGLVVPAHLGGSDHQHHHHHHHDHDRADAETQAARATTGADVSACDPNAHETDDHHHRGHDHQLLIPGKGGSGVAKVIAITSALTALFVANGPSPSWTRIDPQRAPGRIDRTPALARGPPAAATLVV